MTHPGYRRNFFLNKLKELEDYPLDGLDNPIKEIIPDMYPYDLWNLE